jgi:hypothetical protein
MLSAAPLRWAVSFMVEGQCHHQALFITPEFDPHT